MPITGGIKFFKKSKALFALGATATATSNTDAAKNILSSNKFVIWQSLASDDTTTETIVITFPASADIDRIFLISMNWKEFTVKYDVTGTPTDFTNVVGLDGSQSVIAETAYARDTAYYEFDKVNTTKITITATKTQIVDAEKQLERFYATEEIGTFTGFPGVPKEELNQNLNKQRVLSGNINFQKRIETFKATINFKNYTAIQNDYDILLDLERRPESFLIWLCGGKFGANFSITRENWFLKNVYNVQTPGKLNAKWNNNIYIAGFSAKLNLEQATEER